MSEDLFAGQEEEDSSVDDLTPSVTSNNSDVLQRPQGTAAPSPPLMEFRCFISFVTALLGFILYRIFKYCRIVTK